MKGWSALSSHLLMTPSCMVELAHLCRDCRDWCLSRAFGCTWGEEGTGWIFLGEAVPFSAPPTSRAWPGTSCQSLELWRQCSTPVPGATNSAPNWPNDWKCHLGEKPKKAKGYLRLNLRQVCMLTFPEDFYQLSTPGTPELVSIRYIYILIFYIFFVFLLLISSQYFWVTYNWMGLEFAMLNVIRMLWKVFYIDWMLH